MTTSEPQDIAALRARLVDAEWAWGWHEEGPDPDGDVVREGYGHHMAQMLYRLPIDGQTRDMRNSVTQMLADQRALLSEVERGWALRAAVEALAEEWGLGDEAEQVEHVVGCQDFGCKTCVVIACATDLRALLAAHVPSPLPVGGAAGAGEGT